MAFWGVCVCVCVCVLVILSNLWGRNVSLFLETAELEKLIFLLTSKQMLPHLQLRQEPQGSSDFRLRSQGPCRLGTGESGLVLG